MTQPAAYDMAALLAAHTLRVDGEEMRTHFDQHGVQYGPAFTGLGAALINDGTADGTASSVLAEVALPPSIRSQLNSYGIHPALLDACFQAIAAHPDVQAALSGGLMLPLGVRRLRAFGSARNACYCYIRDTNTSPAGIEADLDVLDEHGTVLLAVQGLLLGAGASEQGNRNRVLNERLLTIEWQSRKLPETDQTDSGPWLLISTATGADAAASALTDALTQREAQSRDGVLARVAGRP